LAIDKRFLWQRSRDKEIKEGDKNAEEKKTISSLEENGTMFSDNDGMLKHAVYFYKTLFGEETRDSIRLDDAF
jgi:hypothetical protein